MSDAVERLKPKTWYYTLDDGKTYHELPYPVPKDGRMLAAKLVRTDEHGEIIRFKQRGEEFRYE